MLARVVFTAMLLTAIAAPCPGQDTALTQPSLGILSRPTSIEALKAMTSCPAFIGDHRDLLEASVPDDSTTVACTVERVDSLGNAMGLRWHVVK